MHEENGRQADKHGALWYPIGLHSKLLHSGDVKYLKEFSMFSVIQNIANKSIVFVMNNDFFIIFFFFWTASNLSIFIRRFVAQFS